jgi:hypothetical protein
METLTIELELERERERELELEPLGELLTMALVGEDGSELWSLSAGRYSFLERRRLSHRRRLYVEHIISITTSTTTTTINFEDFCHLQDEASKLLVIINTTPAYSAMAKQRLMEMTLRAVTTGDGEQTGKGDKGDKGDNGSTSINRATILSSIFRANRVDLFASMQKDLRETQSIVLKSVELLTQRGTSLGALEQQADTMVAETKQLFKHARSRLRRCSYCSRFNYCSFLVEWVCRYAFAIKRALNDWRSSAMPRRSCAEASVSMTTEM